MAYWKEHPGLFIGFYVSIGDPSEPESLVDTITGLDASDGINLITRNNGSVPIDDCHLIARSKDYMSQKENINWYRITSKRVIDDRRVNYAQTPESMFYLLDQKIYPFQESHFGKENYLIKYNEV